MPGSPAPPRNRAQSDQMNAARTPTEIRVSMVTARWRAFIRAARWIGQAPQTTTGAASVSESHCQKSNCRTGIIARTTTGTVSALQMISRARSAPAGEVSTASRAVSSRAGSGRRAE
ncbi:unannotated protein [freshwater metagenome]|uniref:Unannotated protein n=1 Tax=freshwater metagenome TaxID=449393 RepID=A0A6J6UGJ6_9ZZZZ